MKKRILFGISLIILGGIIIGSSLIAGSIHSSGLNIAQGIRSLDENYLGGAPDNNIFGNTAVLIFTVIGSIISIVGIIISIFDLTENEK